MAVSKSSHNGNHHTPAASHAEKPAAARSDDAVVKRGRGRPRIHPPKEKPSVELDTSGLPLRRRRGRAGVHPAPARARFHGGGDGGGGNRAPRANPFARPSKPVVSAPQAEALVEVDASAETAASPESVPEAVLDTPETSSAATAEAPPASDGASTPADDGDATVDAGATVDATVDASA